jgi:short-subunit dehydrogenase
LIAGASDGVGAAFARAVAARGVNVVLVARRQAVLDEVAESIRSTTGVEARTMAVDLAAPDAAATIVQLVDGLEVGLLVYCAGSDASYAPFLEQPVANALQMIQRNCAVPIELCHRFGGSMAARGRGGIVIFGSGAGLCGLPNLVAYASTKAFDMVLAEALWSELHGKGVDVLGLILSVTDTPALRRLQVRRGVLASEDDPSPIPGSVSSTHVAEEGVRNLANGPTLFVGEMLEEVARQLGAMPRNDAVRLMIELSGGAMGESKEVTG